MSEAPTGVFTHLRVPLPIATEWDWLEDDLEQAAEKWGLVYDGVEEEGSFLSHLFYETDVETVEKLATHVLERAGDGVSLAKTGDHEITVTVRSGGQSAAEPQGPWLTALGPARHPYDRAVKELVDQVNDDEQLTQWHSKAGLAQVSFHQQSTRQGDGFYTSDDPLPGEIIATVGTDLDVLDVKRPSQDDVTQAARRTVEKVLRHLAEMSKTPLPQPPWAS